MSPIRHLAGPAALLFTTTLGAQTLSLGQALDRADRSAYPNRIAEGTVAGRNAMVTATLRGILPSLRVETGFARTTDPIGAFGTVLRQRSITQADFAPDRLNFPAPINNYLGGLVVEQPLFNADAWTGRRAALRGVAAAERGGDWTRIATRVEVVRAYYGAVLAGHNVQALEAASRAGHAHRRQAESLVRQGMATRSDALLASVLVGETDAQLADARAEAGTARRQLAVLLGADVSDLPPLPDGLPEASRIRAVVAADTMDLSARTRADVEAAAHEEAAARLDVQRARSLYLPRLDAFARFDWNSATHLYAGDRSWTLGVMASWSPFAGASRIAELRSSAARADAADAMADEARARAGLESEQTANALWAALTRLDIAERAVQQSAEAHRIVERKYEGGLATISELLDAAAIEMRSALGFSHARYTAIVADAERRKALGLDPAALAVLDQPGTAPTIPR